MSKSREAPVFLDTSIQIARLVHGPQTKSGIRQRLAQHDKVFTGLVVRQEFKRRLLKEAEYLLRFAAITMLNGRPSARKHECLFPERNICKTV
jgi:hypothetical protein